MLRTPWIERVLLACAAQHTASGECMRRQEYKDGEGQPHTVKESRTTQHGQHTSTPHTHSRAQRSRAIRRQEQTRHRAEDTSDRRQTCLQLEPLAAQVLQLAAAHVVVVAGAVVVVIVVAVG